MATAAISFFASGIYVVRKKNKATMRLLNNRIVATSVVIIALSLSLRRSFAFLNNHLSLTLPRQYSPSPGARCFSRSTNHASRGRSTIGTWPMSITHSTLFEKNDTDDSSEETKPKKLIFGEEMKKKISEFKSKYPTSEAAYLDAAKKRAGEYQVKKELGLLDYCDGLIVPKGGDASVNCGPEDLSTFKGFADEGWEDSLKQNDMSSLIGGAEDVIKEEKDETPSLLIFDTKSDSDDKLLLI